MTHLSNKKWLIVITVILASIFILLLMNVAPKTQGEKIGSSISDVIDSADESFEEFKEEVIDEIDDHTDSQ